MPSPSHDPAMALRDRFQKGIFVTWQWNGMVCVNQTWPHCVNQMGKTQSEALQNGMAGERLGMCELALNKVIRLSHCLKFWNVGKLEVIWIVVKE
jgi:hypothetical protein